MDSLQDNAALNACDAGMHSSARDACPGVAHDNAPRVVITGRKASKSPAASESVDSNDQRDIETRIWHEESKLAQESQQRGGADTAGEANATVEVEQNGQMFSVCMDTGERVQRLTTGRRSIWLLHPVRCENTEPEAAHIDWLSFTLIPPDNKGNAWVSSELKRLAGFASITRRKNGLFGYKESALIEEGGLMAWGGKNQRGTVYVSLNSQGCGRITDWPAIHAWMESYQVRITRIDLAHDDFTGDAISIDKAVEWYQEDRFNIGGRPPSTNVAGDWIALKRGRTFYIGRRENGKLLRIYEKGKQLGDEKSPWVRAELELHNKSRLIPHDAMTAPGQFLAGAYPNVTDRRNGANPGSA